MSEEIKQSLEDEKEPHLLPMLAMRGIIPFPNTSIQFDVQREKSQKALTFALENGQEIFLVAQKDLRIEEPEQKDLYVVGVVAEVIQTFRISPDVVRVLMESKSRAKIVDLNEADERSMVEFEYYPMKKIRTEAQRDNVSALVRMIKRLFESLSNLSPAMPNEVIADVMAIEDGEQLVNFICSNLLFPFQNKQKILEESNLIKQLEKLLEDLEKEVEILTIESDIALKTKDSIDQNQRDYYLREQMRVISQELGEDGSSDEVMKYFLQLDKLEVSEEVREKLISEIEKFAKTPPSSQESAVQRQYLDTVFGLPWNEYTKDRLNLEFTKKMLDKDHYGLEKVKERIIELLAVRKLNPEIKGQIICLVGPPGVGKTSIARSIADSMKRKYVRISLGGVRDESDIRGHRKTYVGSMPGRIINGIKQAKSQNPLILLDEVDKMGNDFRGDPSSALLEVLDPEQNRTFTDHYLDIPFDLSQALFITTANTLETIPGPLRDRMEIISLSSYTREEKFHIAKSYLLSKQIVEHGFQKKNLRLTDGAFYGIIDYYTREAGVRGLEKALASICRRTAVSVVENPNSKVVVNEKNLEDFMGPRRFRPDHIFEENIIGMVNGLAWTSVGGEMLRIEVGIMKGTGKLQLTGSLGDVIKESAQIAVSYVRSRAEDFGIDPDFYKKQDIHIHAPEGAVPKDGPSAGVAMITALVSALTEKPIRRDVAMTGEVTLRGLVLPIGGLREKSMAAYRAGATIVFIPNDNKGDLEEVDTVVKEHIEFIPVENVEEVLERAIVGFSVKLPSEIPQKIVAAKHLQESIPPIKREQENRVTRS